MNNPHDALSQYEITHEEITPYGVKKLPDHIKNELDDLRERAYSGDQSVIKRLLKLHYKYRATPIFANYLSVLYERTGQREKSYALVKESYKRHPNYLFARVNYAMLCLVQDEKPDEVPKILGKQLDIHALFPHRKFFHVSEACTFYGVVALYYHSKGDQDNSLHYYHFIKQLDPRDFMVNQAKKTIIPNLWQRLRKRLSRWLESKVKETERR